MKSNQYSYLLLMAGAMLMLFSNGRWTFSLAAWLYPVFMLRFLRMQKSLNGFILMFVAIAIVNPIIWWKMMPLPPAFYFILTTVLMQLMTIPFLADRLLAPRIRGFASTLIFPLTYCSIEYLMAVLTPKGTWTALAYSQANNHLLMQLASVTGIWGISFFVMWFASTMNWLWSHDFKWRVIRNGVLEFSGVAATILLFGIIRLNYIRPIPGTVLTASIVQQRDLNKGISSCRWTDAKGIEKYSDELEVNLLDKTEQAANAGAKIVLWQESAGFIPKGREIAFTEKASQLAKRKKIYLFMSLWSVPEDFPLHRVENKMIIIDSLGNTKLTYIKNNPAPPEPIIKGDGSIPTIQTSFGLLAPAICADADYQDFIRQAGRKKVDIMFIPANDWAEITPLHSQMAITRAIENGFALVHPAGQGLSVVADNRGRILSSMDYFKTDKQILLAAVPIHRDATFYALAGDYFPMLAMLGLLSIFIWVNVSRKRVSGQTKGSAKSNFLPSL